MMKNAMTMFLAVAFTAAALPKFSYAQEQSVDQVIEMKKAQDQAKRQQLLELKASLSDMQTELRKEEGKFVLVAAKWARRLSIIVGISSVAGVMIGNQKSLNLLAASVVGVGVSALVGILSQITVALTNDQVDELDQRITDILVKISTVEAELK